MPVTPHAGRGNDNRHGLDRGLPLAALAVARQWACPGMLRIGTRVRFVEAFRPDTVAPGTVGIVVLIEPLPAVFGPPSKGQGHNVDFRRADAPH
jgi:hypothetical protein